MTRETNLGPPTLGGGGGGGCVEGKGEYIFGTRYERVTSLVLSSVTKAKDVKSACNDSHNDYRVVFFQFHPTNHA